MIPTFQILAKKKLVSSDEAKEGSINNTIILSYNVLSCNWKSLHCLEYSCDNTDFFYQRVKS